MCAVPKLHRKPKSLGIHTAAVIENRNLMDPISPARVYDYLMFRTEELYDARTSLYRIVNKFRQCVRGVLITIVPHGLYSEVSRYYIVV
jgi:hypothetical protein